MIYKKLIFDRKGYSSEMIIFSNLSFFFYLYLFISNLVLKSIPTKYVENIIKKVLRFPRYCEKTIFFKWSNGGCQVRKMSFTFTLTSPKYQKKKLTSDNCLVFGVLVQTLKAYFHFCQNSLMLSAFNGCQQQTKRCSLLKI